MLVRSLSRFFAAALAAGALVAYGAAPSFGSDHQDSPQMVGRPGADITDVFLFPAADPKKVVMAVDVHPLIPPSLASTTYFDPGVLYQIKVANDPSRVESHVVQFKAEGVGDGQQVGVYLASPAHGGTVATLGNKLGAASFNQRADLPGGVSVFAGPREEPFSFDLTQFFKIDPDRNYKNQPTPPAPSARCFRKPGIDALTGYDVLSLIVELPRTLFADAKGNVGVVHVWATTSVEQNGRWTQVERLARPAVKEAFESFKNHAATNRVAPWPGDTLLQRSIRDYMMRPVPDGAGRSAAVADAMVKLLMPDQLTANLAQPGPARYLAVETNGKSGLPTGVIRTVPVGGIEGLKKFIGDPLRQFGGRDLNSPVIDLSLGAIYGSLIPKLGLAPDDGKETACLTSDNVGTPKRHFTKTFPYLGNPL